MELQQGGTNMTGSIDQVAQLGGQEVRLISDTAGEIPVRIESVTGGEGIYTLAIPGDAAGAQLSQGAQLTLALPDGEQIPLRVADVSSGGGNLSLTVTAGEEQGGEGSTPGGQGAIQGPAPQEGEGGSPAAAPADLLAEEQAAAGQDQASAEGGQPGEQADAADGEGERGDAAGGSTPPA